MASVDVFTVSVVWRVIIIMNLYC